MLYNRGLINSMLGVEAIRTAQKKFGNKPLTGEQVRWGFENLNLTADAHQGARLRGHAEADQALLRGPPGRAIRPASSSGTARQWKIISDWYTADQEILEPMVKDAAAKYAAEKKITPRDCSKES